VTGVRRIVSRMEPIDRSGVRAIVLDGNFVVRVPAEFTVRLDEADKSRWWSLSELEHARARGVVIWPERLEEYLRSFLEHGPPHEPVDIGD